MVVKDSLTEGCMERPVGTSANLECLIQAEIEAGVCCAVENNFGALRSRLQRLVRGWTTIGLVSTDTCLTYCQ